jgi:hypothetical protein
MVGEQVGRRRQHRGQLRRRGVADGERVDDAQPGPVGQRRVQRGPPLQRGSSFSVHCLNLD